ncbi:hypothetical protein KFK09_022663 [Dendrobium nobile]|uniref:Uncharacterized protein n=1 Tax=Dendrobium nobile TaxID=94219 RepID=A0A8T3AJC9_DENNO|nr:hypothetical protein KFK09_022663 [Dendrobium nobile]
MPKPGSLPPICLSRHLLFISKVEVLSNHETQDQEAFDGQSSSWLWEMMTHHYPSLRLPLLLRGKEKDVINDTQMSPIVDERNGNQLEEGEVVLVEVLPSLGEGKGVMEEDGMFMEDEYPQQISHVELHSKTPSTSCYNSDAFTDMEDMGLVAKCFPKDDNDLSFVRGAIRDNNGKMVVAFVGPIQIGNYDDAITLAILYGLKVCSHTRLHESMCYLNSRCSCHISGDANQFISLKVRARGKVTLGDNTTKKVVGTGYSSIGKSFRVFNKRTLVMEETTHVVFQESNSEKSKVEEEDEVGEITQGVENTNMEERGQLENTNEIEKPLYGLNLAPREEVKGVQVLCLARISSRGSMDSLVAIFHLKRRCKDFMPLDEHKDSLPYVLSYNFPIPLDEGVRDSINSWRDIATKASKKRASSSFGKGIFISTEGEERKPSHIKTDCPKLKATPSKEKVEEKPIIKNGKKKFQRAFWADSASDSSKTEKDEEVTNL